MLQQLVVTLLLALPFALCQSDGNPHVSYNETLFYCWRMYIGNYSQVVMVITCENNEFTTSS